jgi:Zinc binding domain
VTQFAALSRYLPGARQCPGCGRRGATVQLQTVKALLTEVALTRVQQTHYRFCSDAICATVYFGDAGDRFETQDLRVAVWHKEPAGERLLCYCFGENERDVRAELMKNGHSGVIDRIRTHIAAQRCACDIRNPRGACCLGDVIVAVNRITAENAEGKTNDGALTNVPDR